jgi:hypothetical protein
MNGYLYSKYGLIYCDIWNNYDITKHACKGVIVYEKKIQYFSTARRTRYS